MIRGCVLAVLLLPGAALAQTADVPVIPLIAPVATGTAAAIGEAPLITLVAPAGAAAPPQAPADRDAGQTSQTAPGATPPVDWLLPLMPAQANLPTEVRIGNSLITPSQLRLTGEVVRADFTLTVPDGVAVPTDLTLGLRSSVNVLPKTSYFDVQVNGADAGRITLDNIGEFATKTIAVPGLVPGANRVSLSGLQNHRIFCGPEASFAVWTEVDLATSGSSVAPSALPLDASGFVAALQAQAASGGAVEILVEDMSDTTLTRQIAARIVDTLGGAPRVDVRPFHGPQASTGARARVALIAADMARVTVRRGAGGALVLQIEHQTGSLPDLDAYLPAQPGGWDALPLTPGRSTPLSDLGVDMVVAKTRYFRQDVTFLLPGDWLYLASQKADFTIHYGFSADLPQGALLLVKVNGQTVRLLPLDRNGGQVQPPLDISFAASLLNPGINALTFEMSVPGDPPDLPCTPRDTDMLVVLGDSTLNVPPSPQMRQPGIANTLARLDGAAVTTPDPLTDAARNARTRLAFGALFRPLAAGDTGAAALHVVGLEGAGMAPTGTTGVTRRMLQNAVFPMLDAVPETTPTPAVAFPPAPAFSLAPAEGQAAPETGAATGAPAGDTLWQRAKAALSVPQWVPRGMGGTLDVSLTGNIPLADWLDGKSGLALLLQLDPKSPDDVWLIAGPGVDMAELAAQVDRFRRAPRPDAHEQLALLQADGTWATWSERRAPELLESLTPGNLRPVLGNFASWSPVVFTGLTMILALLSIIPALLFVLMTRRSGSRT